MEPWLQVPEFIPGCNPKNEIALLIVTFGVLKSNSFLMALIYILGKIFTDFFEGQLEPIW